MATETTFVVGLLVGFAVLLGLWKLLNAAFKKSRTDEEAHGLWLDALLGHPWKIMAAVVLCALVLALVGFSASDFQINLDMNVAGYLKADTEEQWRLDAVLNAVYKDDRDSDDGDIVRRLTEQDDRSLIIGGSRYWKLDLIYRAKDSDRGVFTEDALREIQHLELAVQNHPGFDQHCQTFTSILAVFFGDQAFESWDGQTVDEAALREGAVELARRGDVWWADKDFSASDPVSEYTRSHYFRSHDWGDTASSEEWLKKLYEDLLLKTNDEAPYEHIEVTWYERDHLFPHEVVQTLWHDILWSIGSFAFVFVFLFFQMWSLTLVCAAAVCVLLAFAAAVFFIFVLGGYEDLTLLDFISVFLVLGIAADNVLVMFHTYRLSKEAPGVGDSQRERMAWAYKVASNSMFVTSATTCGSFYSLCLSSVRVIRKFGFLMGTVLALDYLLVVSFFPAAILVSDKGATGPVCRKGPVMGCSDRLVRKAVAGAIWRGRGFLLLVTLLLGAAAIWRASEDVSISSRELEVFRRSRNIGRVEELTRDVFADYDYWAYYDRGRIDIEAVTNGVVPGVGNGGGGGVVPDTTAGSGDTTPTTPEAVVVVVTGTTATSSTSPSSMSSLSTSTVSSGSSSSSSTTNTRDVTASTQTTESTPSATTETSRSSLSTATTIGGKGTASTKSSSTSRGSISTVSSRSSVSTATTQGSATTLSSQSATVTRSSSSPSTGTARSSSSTTSTSASGSSSSSSSSSTGSSPLTTSSRSSTSTSATTAAGATSISTASSRTSSSTTVSSAASTSQSTPTTGTSVTSISTSTSGASSISTVTSTSSISTVTSTSSTDTTTRSSFSTATSTSATTASTASGETASSTSHSSISASSLSSATTGSSHSSATSRSSTATTDTSPTTSSSPLSTGSPVSRGTRSSVSSTTTSRTTGSEGTTSVTSSTSTSSSTEDCLNSCSGLGTCDYETLECRCYAGHEGPDCSERTPVLHPLESCVEVWLVFGIAGHRVVDGTEAFPVFDHNFDIRRPTSQEWLKNVTRTAREDSRLQVRDEFPIWIEEFEEHLAARDIKLPLASSLFMQNLAWFSEVTSGDFDKDYDFPLDNSSVGRRLTGGEARSRYARLRLRVNVLKNAERDVLEPVQDLWDDFLQTLNAQAPANMKMLVVSRTFTLINIEREVVESTKKSFLVSMAISFVCLVTFSGNLVTSLYAILAMVLTLGTLSFALVTVLGWKVGAVQAMAVTILVGMSIDYSFHMVTGYQEEKGLDSRKEKARVALVRLLTAIVGGAVTTMGSVAFLFPCWIYLFVQLGIMIFTNSLVALCYTVLFLVPLLMLAGPVGICGDIYACLCCSCASGGSKEAPAMRSIDAVDAPEPTGPTTEGSDSSPEDVHKEELHNRKPWDSKSDQATGSNGSAGNGSTTASSGMSPGVVTYGRSAGEEPEQPKSEATVGNKLGEFNFNPPPRRKRSKEVQKAGSATSSPEAAPKLVTVPGKSTPDFLVDI